MSMDWELFIAAVGLAFVFEGAVYFIFAERMPEMLRVLSESPPRLLRFAGMSAIILGLLTISLARML